MTNLAPLVSGKIPVSFQPTVDAAGLGPLLVIRKSFSAGVPGSADDVTIYNADAPFAFRIIDSFALVSTLIALSTLTLRTATAGGGSAVSDVWPSAAIGVQRNVLMTASSTIALNGTLVLRRSDIGVAGEVMIIIQKT